MDYKCAECKYFSAAGTEGEPECNILIGVPGKERKPSVNNFTSCPYQETKFPEPKRTAFDKEKDKISEPNVFPQHTEENEFRYLSPVWLNELAKGLTKGAKEHTGETWRGIPTKEHAYRAVRHLIMWLAGDRSDTHIINASMRCMMAFETEKKEGEMK